MAIREEVNEVQGEFRPIRNPLDYSSLWSHLTFGWISPLIRLGSQRPLEFEDVYPIPERFQTGLLHDKITKAWEIELKIAKENLREPYVGYALIRAFYPTVVLGAITFAPYLATNLIQPLFVKQILSYVSTGSFSFLGITNPYGLVVFLTALSLINIVSFNHSFFLVSQAGLFCKSSVVSLVFNKSIMISASSKNSHTTGEIITLMSVDSERVWQAVLFVNWLWSGPITVAIAMALLIVEIGVAAVAAIGVMLLINYVQKKSGDKAGEIRRQLIKHTDERVKVMNESLQGIRVVKLYNWEDPIQKRIVDLRAKEVASLFYYHMYKMINTALMFIGPLLVAFAIFIAYVTTGGTLTVPQVYTVYALLNLLRLPFALTPQAWTAASEAFVSLNRISKFLQLEEIDKIQSPDESAGANSTESTIVSIKNSDFYWESKDEIKAGTVKPALTGISIDIHKGDFIAVVGSVGAGKSSFLSAILGQMNRDLSKGEQTLKGKVAYISQEHWIQNMKLIDNVTFGTKFDENRYVHSIDASQSSKDLLSLPHADFTSIGERGINLSGGQKARVSIARALYSEDTELFLIDDALAAVDVHVGKALFEDAIDGLLKNKTRVVVLSSNYHLLPRFRKIIVIIDGNIAKVGTYADIISEYPQYSSDENEVETMLTTSLDQEVSSNDIALKSTPNDVTSSNAEVDRDERVSEFRSYSATIAEKRAESTNIMTMEDREKGAVSMSTYFDYFSAAIGNKRGSIVFFLIILLFAVSQSIRVLSDIWMGIWAQSQEQQLKSGSSSRSSGTYYLTGYVVLVGITTILVMFRSYSFIQSCIQASHSLHAVILRAVLWAPINTYFDVTPVGRILNRFSKDLDSMDSVLPDFFLQNLQNLAQVLSIVVVCVISTPYMVLLMVPIAILFFNIQNYFRKCSRELKRLDGISRSPIFSLYGEVLQGISTIRAYGRIEEYQQKLFTLTDAQAANFFTFWCSSRWLAIRLDFVGVCIIFSVSILAVGLAHGSNIVDTNTLGIALVYSLQLTGLLQWTVRVTIETETNMTSVERLLTFAKIEPEALAPVKDTNIGFVKFLRDHENVTVNGENLLGCGEESVLDIQTSPNDPLALSKWPYKGCIQITNLRMRYRPELDLVLDGVSVSIPGGSKVGICGRTGSGKSSLMLALFRIVEPEPGSSIEIDGTSILDMSIAQLRSSLTIIPQDPVMFSGSLRYNLDPFEQHTDDQVWEAIDRAQFKNDIIEKFPNKLLHEVSERGENISVGQRQLICIARALLRQSKVIVMDEATASVDSVTDSKIQETIRKEFKNCTVLTIAHRLETIADYDKLIIMNNGCIGEQGSPYQLLLTPGSLFKGLVDELGPDRQEKLTALAKQRDSENLGLKQKMI